MRIVILTIFVMMVSLPAQAAASPGGIRLSHRHDAGLNKAGNYISEGYFVGGERAVTTAKLKDIRRARSGQGFERIVLDLEALADEKNSVPYFQVQTAPQEGRVVLSIWADVGYDFDGNRIRKAFSKSANVKRLNIMPRLEDGLTIIEFVLRNPKPAAPKKVEAFRLTQPARIILDII